MIEDTLIGEAGELADALTRWRRDFHRHPEVGLECHRTAERVCDVLQEVGIEVSRGWAKTGVVAIVSPEAEKKGSAEAVALRVDMDGLPVHEETGASYASTRAGYAHACGHDGHVAIGLGVAYLLNRHRRELASPVKLIFQPGEESPGGARLMLEEGVLRDPPVGAVFGLHLFPGLPAGQIGLRYGVMTAGSNDFTVTLRGKAGHAGHPHLAVDPVPALAAFIDAVQSLVSRAHNPLDPLIIS
ncbi:MAG TPA: amidohydrolase, partial [Firmicutes bacterium]|nr:amidohydrolase [Bacillota bacterium]